MYPGDDLRIFLILWGIDSLFHEDDENGEDEIYDLAQMTMGCGRRGDSLKMAFGWIYYGKDGYQGENSRGACIFNAPEIPALMLSWFSYWLEVRI